jgi:prepilin-type N-terminal cleavage/methylation domain-containing protein
MKNLRLSSQGRRAFQGSSRGFILVEVLIAIALIGIVAASILGSLSTSSKVISVADERTTAESLARRQMEYVKSQGYNCTESLLDEPTYQKISSIPEGYSMWSVNLAGEIVDDIVGIPWNSEDNKPAVKDLGLQKIALVIKHQEGEDEYRVISTFINGNPHWAPGVEITLEGYKVNR